MDLSIVVTSRNDGHGGNLVERTNLFLDTTHQLCQEEQVEVEVIMVEWNLPPEKGLLREELSIPPGLTFRTIVVPPKVHDELDHADILSIYQMIAKNVGIRRAKGEWILATNPDLVYTPEVFHRIYIGLSPQCVYRVPRIDVHTTELPGLTNAHDVLDWMRCRPVTKHTNTWNDTGLVTMACGDFTLMHRAAWEATRGYAEVQMWSPHVDSLLLTQAINCGYEQVFWEDAGAYHLDHHKSLSTEPQYQETYPTIEFGFVEQCYRLGKQFRTMANGMGKGLCPMVVFNDLNWGYPDHEFEEIV